MRNNLAHREGERDFYIGRVANINPRDRTILLKNIVTDSGKFTTDHMWFKFSQDFRRMNLRNGEAIRFRGRIQRYHKKDGLDFGVFCIGQITRHSYT